MSLINWGIIGCGDVTEIKSGPAFNKVLDSKLTAVMRRNAAKAKDYASRHQVPKWYSNANDLIRDPEVNAIYIATPPLYHEEYTLAALQAGKPVYVEKPMTMNAASAIRMMNAAEQTGVKLSIAHYRRGLPVFNRIKQLLDEKVIGKIRLVNLQLFQSVETEMIAKSEENWRVDPQISGGGLFHDLAPHQLDLMLYFFGETRQIQGISLNQAKLYPADDMVSGQILFENDVLFNGLWSFTVSKEASRDTCEIVGTEGSIRFPVFGQHFTLDRNGKEERFEFDKPEHIQQPMIEQVVNYFLNRGENPCPAIEGVKVMEIMDRFTTGK